MFLIHLLACPWGSIISGQRCEFVTIIALSSEKLKVLKERNIKSVETSKNINNNNDNNDDENENDVGNNINKY